MSDDAEIVQCSGCRRAVLAAHIDGEGRCCYCVPPRAQEADRPRPAIAPARVPLQQIAEAHE